MKLSRMQRFLSYLALTTIALFALFPLYWMLASSFRPRDVLFQTPPPAFYVALDLTYYASLFRETPFGRMFLNSMFVALVTTVITVIVGAMAGHSLARMRFRGKILISRGILIAYVFPQVLLVVPLFVAMVNFGLANTFTGLILTYLTFSFPFCMWMLTAYFQTIPLELEEAGLIDGASRFGVFVRIVLPLSKPGLTAAGIFTFIHAWNEFLYALVLLNSEDKATLSLGLYRLLGGETVEWGEILAATSIMVMPVLVVFLFYQRHLVSGLTAGATKG